MAYAGLQCGLQPSLAHDLADSTTERTADVIAAENEGKTFSDLLLPDKVLFGLKNAGFAVPSPIQWKAIPVAKMGLDVLVQAKSGTGKTLVFVITALSSVDVSVKHIQCLVIAPTREIAVQAARTALEVGAGMKELKVSTFIGGMAVKDDISKLSNCHIAIGTPGRIKQLMEDGHLRARAIRLFVLDESDKLMEDSFVNDITWIFNSLPSTKQVLALSATYPDQMAEVLSRYMRHPTHVRLGQHDQVLEGVSHFTMPLRFHPVQQQQLKIKFGTMVRVLNEIAFNQCLVFCNYATRAEVLCTMALALGWPAIHIAGSQNQMSRLKAIDSLKMYQCRVLFTTDLTARGIDAQNVNLVVHFDVPWDSSTYLHRVGRCGRFGTRGVSLALATEGREWELLRKIAWKTGAKIKIVSESEDRNEDKQSSPADLFARDPDQYQLVEPLECEEEEEEEASKAAEDTDNATGKAQIGKGKAKRRGKKKAGARTNPDLPVSNGEEFLNGEEELADDLALGWSEVKSAASESQEIVASFARQYANCKANARDAALRQELPPLDQVRSSCRAFAATPGNPASQSSFVLTNEASSLPSIPSEVARAALSIVAQERSRFEDNLAVISRNMARLSTEEQIAAVKHGKALPEDTLPPAATSRVEAHGEAISQILSKIPLTKKALETKRAAPSSSFAYALPYPDPHACIGADPLGDSDWFDAWWQQVQANRQFIEDMELCARMKSVIPDSTLPL